MRTFMLPLSAVMLTAIFIVPASAQELSSGINPFKQKSPEGVSDISLNANQDKSQSLWSKLSVKPRKNTGQPSTAQKLNQNTKQFMKKSQQTLMPWTKPKKASSPITGLREKPKSAENWNPLSALFKPAEKEPQEFRTANDWFKQPRPQLSR